MRVEDCSISTLSSSSWWILKKLSIFPCFKAPLFVLSCPDLTSSSPRSKCRPIHWSQGSFSKAKRCQWHWQGRVRQREKEEGGKSVLGSSYGFCGSIFEEGGREENDLENFTNQASIWVGLIFGIWIGGASVPDSQECHSFLVIDQTLRSATYLCSTQPIMQTRSTPLLLWSSNHVGCNSYLARWF